MLFALISKDDVVLVENLLKKGFDVNVKDSREETPLCIGMQQSKTIDFNNFNGVQ